MMKQSTKIWLLTAAALVVLGLTLLGFALSRWDFDFTANYETNTHTVTEAFTGLTVKTGTADISFRQSEDGSCRVVCYEEKNRRHTVSVEAGMLRITEEDRREWYNRLFTWGTPAVTVYLPEQAYETLRIDSSTGDIRVPDFLRFEGLYISSSTGDVHCEAAVSDAAEITVTTGQLRVENTDARTLLLSATTGDVEIRSVTCAEALQVEVTTGDLRLTDVTCDSLSSQGSTGDLTLERVIASDRFDLQRSTGDIILSDCDAGRLTVETSTGDVTGTLRSDKLFFTQSSTGDVSVPRTTTGGVCEITTSTGDIEIAIQ